MIRRIKQSNENPSLPMIHKRMEKINGAFTENVFEYRVVYYMYITIIYFLDDAQL